MRTPATASRSKTFSSKCNRCSRLMIVREGSLCRLCEVTKRNERQRQDREKASLNTALAAAASKEIRFRNRPARHSLLGDTAHLQISHTQSTTHDNSTESTLPGEPLPRQYPLGGPRNDPTPKASGILKRKYGLISTTCKQTVTPDTRPLQGALVSQDSPLTDMRADNGAKILAHSESQNAARPTPKATITAFLPRYPMSMISVDCQQSSNWKHNYQSSPSKPHSIATKEPGWDENMVKSCGSANL